MTGDPAARIAVIDSYVALGEELKARHGTPEYPEEAVALVLAGPALVAAGVTAGEVHVSIYRDDAAADAWLAFNLAHHGHPALARLPLPDGRVVGVLDLRPALARARRDASDEERQ